MQKEKQSHGKLQKQGRHKVAAREKATMSDATGVGHECMNHDDKICFLNLMRYRTMMEIFLLMNIP